MFHLITRTQLFPFSHPPKPIFDGGINSQLPESMKHSQADLYLETYQVLDLEMSRLREIQRWQASAASKVIAKFNLSSFLCLTLCIKGTFCMKCKKGTPSWRSLEIL